MKAKFCETVERGRVRKGYWTSEPGDTFGAFVLASPKSGKRFKVLVGDGEGWDHVSVSCADRTPTWDEMCWVKRLFFRDDEWAVQYHPAGADYININANCLHLWRPQEDTLPTPPKAMV